MPRFQFSLRTLLLVTLIIPCGVSVWLHREPIVKTTAIPPMPDQWEDLSQLEFAAENRVICADYHMVYIFTLDKEKAGQYVLAHKSFTSGDPASNSRISISPDAWEIMFPYLGMTAIDLHTYKKKGFDRVFCDPQRRVYSSTVPNRFLENGHEGGLGFYINSEGNIRNTERTYSPYFTFLPDGNRFINIWHPRFGLDTQHSILCISNFETGDDQILAPLPEGKITGLACSPKGDTFALLVNGQVYFWSVATGKPLFVIDQKEQRTLHYTPDGNLLFTTGKDGQLRFWNTHDGSLQFALGSKNTPIRIAAMSRDGNRLATAGDEDKPVDIWTIRSAISFWRLGSLPEFWIGLILLPLFLASIVGDRRDRTKRQASTRSSFVPI
jgi:WD40 repeat protein